MGFLNQRRWRRAFDVRSWHWISSAICLFALLLFALTGITLNHAQQLEANAKISEWSAQVPTEVLQQLRQAQDELVLPDAFLAWYQQQFAQALFTGQLQWQSNELYMMQRGPGADIWLSVMLDSGELYQEKTDRGWLAYFNDLHKGRHTNTAWSWFIDIVGGACLVFAVTGLVLLKRYARNRRSTWPLLTLGVLIPLLLLLLPGHATAAQLEVNIPRINSAEYHAPYIAAWLVNDKQQAVANVALWYDLSLADNEGEKWLKDLRLWWRRSGRFADLPIDGVSGATRRPGRAVIDLTPWQSAWQQLPAGQYQLTVEAARELGGREVVRLPLSLPLDKGVEVSAEGQHELGKIQLIWN